MFSYYTLYFYLFCSSQCRHFHKADCIMYFSNRFYPGAYWECCWLAALGPLFVQQRLISVDMKSSYLFLLCYDTTIGSGWRGLLWARTIWNQNPIADMPMRPALLSPGERLSLFFCVRFCPVITFTNCIHWVHEICGFSVKSKPQSGKSNPYFRGRE